MKEWLTANELAAAGLPELPDTERSIQRLAEREGWNLDPYRSRRRTGRGGGMEYNIGLLPTLAQVVYRQRAMAPIGRASAPELQPHAALSGRAARERDARLAILQAYRTFARGQRLNQQGCDQLFCAKYQAGTFPIDDWVKKLVPKFSRRTLARWRAGADANPDGLAHDPGASRRGTGSLDTANGGAVRDYMLGVIAFQPHLSAEAVREQCRGKFGDTVTVRGDREIPMPPLRTFQVALKALKEENKAALTKRTDPDRYRSHMALSGTGSLRHIDQPNLLWQIDASPVDALCTDGRHSIYVCVDIASRRAVFYMSKTARAEAVGLLLRKAILAWGVPAEIKTDNGSDFTARATERLLLSLGVTATLSDEYSPEQKGHVERIIKTFQHDAVPLMPGFIGHSVADRKAIEGRKGFAQRLGMDEAEMFSVQCTAAEMQEHFDAWAELRYAHRPNDGIGGRTPADIAAAASHTIRRVDVRALDILLAPAVRGDGTRVMMKTGIHVDGRPYHCGSILPTQRVFVRMDPLDLGRIYLFDLDGETFLGEGINIEFSGLPAAATLKAQKELRAKAMAEALAPIDGTLREIRKGPGFARIARDVWERDDAKRQAEKADVVAFPRPEVEHTTPHIAAALDAATHRERRATATAVLTPKAAELHAQLKEQSQAVSNVTRLPTAAAKETPRRKFERMYAIELRHAAGEFVDPDDLIALGSYQQTPDYTALRKIYGADRKQSAS